MYRAKENHNKKNIKFILNDIISNRWKMKQGVDHFFRIRLLKNISGYHVVAEIPRNI